MRKLIAALLLAAVPLACSAQDKPAAKEEPKKAKLGVGDAALPLKVTTWHNGDEPKLFEKDKVYILEFWATWCGPCIDAMPHLTELQAEHKKAGLVVIGVTSKDDRGNNAKSVAEFAAKNKAKAGYPLAYCDTPDTDDAYMGASGQNSIPCSFVIGKDGKIAYIGHPDNLDEVLPKVMDGTWKGKADADLLEAREKELGDVFNPDKKPEQRLELMAAFAKKYPEHAKSDLGRGQYMGLLMELKKWDEAKVIAEELIAVSDKTKKMKPASFAVDFVNPDVNPDKKHFEVGVKALETALKYKPTELGLLVRAVDVFAGSGDKEKAAAFAKRAVEAAPDERTKEAVQKVVDEMQKPKK